MTRYARDAEDADAIFCECFLCQRTFRFGPHGIYNGRRIQEWGEMVCDLRSKGNWDGIVPGQHPTSFPH